MEPGELAAGLVPEPVAELLRRLTDPRELYELKALQLVRRPNLRRLPTPFMPVAEAPYRFGAYLLETGQYLREDWLQVDGSSAAAPDVTVPFIRFQPAWAIFLHGALRPPLGAAAAGPPAAQAAAGPLAEENEELTNTAALLEQNQR